MSYFRHNSPLILLIVVVVQCCCGTILRHRLNQEKNSGASNGWHKPLDRVIDGSSVLENDFRKYSYFAQISIYGDNSSHTKRFSCGGTVLNSRYVLTASHCFIMADPWNQLFQIEIVLGTRHNHHRFQALYHQIHYAEEIRMHPDFRKRPPVTTNDIAVIRLNQTIRIGHNITAISLANIGDQPQRNQCFVLGFQPATSGPLVTSLQSARQRLWNSDKCSLNGQRYFFPETEYCGADIGSITKGDSGGPLICPTIGDNRRKQFGLVIGKRWCRLDPDRQKCPNFYTKVIPFVEWIKKESKIID